MVPRSHGRECRDLLKYPDMRVPTAVVLVSAPSGLSGLHAQTPLISAPSGTKTLAATLKVDAFPGDAQAPA